MPYYATRLEQGDEGRLIVADKSTDRGQLEANQYESRRAGYPYDIHEVSEQEYQQIKEGQEMGAWRAVRPDLPSSIPRGTVEYDPQTGATIQITGATQEQIEQQRNVERAIAQGKLQATERESLREQILGITSARESTRKQQGKEFEESFKSQVSIGTQQFLFSKQQALSLFEKQEALNKPLEEFGPAGKYEFRPLTTLEQRYTPEGRIDILKPQGPPSLKSQVAVKAIYGNPLEQTLGSAVLFGLPKAAKAIPSALAFGALAFKSRTAATIVGLAFLPSVVTNLQTSFWEKGIFRTIGEEGPTFGLFAAAGKGGAKLGEKTGKLPIISKYYNKAVKSIGGKIELIEDTGKPLAALKIPYYKRTFEVEKIIGIEAVGEKSASFLKIDKKSGVSSDLLKSKTDFQFVTETKITKRLTTPKPRVDFPAKFQLEQVAKTGTEEVFGKPISKVEVSKSSGILKVENPIIKKPKSAKDIMKPLKQESLDVELRLIENANLEAFKLSSGKSARLFSFKETSIVPSSTTKGRVLSSKVIAKPISRRQAGNILKPKALINYGSKIKKSKIKVFDFRQKKVDLRGGTLAGISTTTKGTKVKPLLVDTDIPEARQIAIQQYTSKQKYYNVKPVLSAKEITGKKFKSAGNYPIDYGNVQLEYSETYTNVKGLPKTSPIIKIGQSRELGIYSSFNFNIKSEQANIPRTIQKDISKPRQSQFPNIDIIFKQKQDSKPIIDIGFIPRQDTFTPLKPIQTTKPKPPRTPPPPPFPTIRTSLPLHFDRKQTARKPRKQSKVFSPFNPKYIPSVGATIFNIRGKKPSRRLYTTGLTLRPLPLLMKRKKRR